MKKIFFVLVLISSLNVFSQQCPSCGGYGKLRCATCGGYGYVVGTVWNPYYGVYQQVQQPCATCRGYGYLICSTCGGSGRRQSPSFRSEQSDGYISIGDVYLTRVVSKIRDKFIGYKNGNSTWVKYGGNYIKVSGRNQVEIGNITYYGL
jgi:hypothetical protein